MNIATYLVPRPTAMRREAAIGSTFSFSRLPPYDRPIVPSLRKSRISTADID